MGARFGEGGRRGFGAADGAGSSVVVVINIDVDNFPIPLPSVASLSGEAYKEGGRQDDNNSNEGDSGIATYCAHRTLHITFTRMAIVKT